MNRITPRDTRSTQPADDWRLRAGCLGQWDLMHPENDTKEIEAAKAVCLRCPVTVDCFFDAVRTGDMEHGIRAGLRGGERRVVLKELRRRQAEKAAQATELAA
ncbi:MAG: WhiB family transcriptional regulator [Streptomyces sp.]|nr:WhiB family transcriptional regulator [Streptomyces sp.]